MVTKMLKLTETESQAKVNWAACPSKMKLLETRLVMIDTRPRAIGLRY